MKKTSKTPALKSEVPRAGLTFQPAARVSETPITNVASEGFATFQPCLTLSEILSRFVAKQTNGKKSNSGENDDTYLKDFITVARFIIDNQKTFQFSEVLALSRNTDTPASALLSLFTQFVNELVLHKRCKIIQGAYEKPVYQIT